MAQELQDAQLQLECESATPIGAVEHVAHPPPAPKAEDKTYNCEAARNIQAMMAKLNEGSQKLGRLKAKQQSEVDQELQQLIDADAKASKR